MKDFEKAKIDCKIIPVPKEVTCFGGTVRVAPAITTQEADWKPLLEVFGKAADKIFHTQVTNQPGAIALVRDDSLSGDRYVIEIDEQVTVFASGYEGAGYGIASVLQLAAFENGEFTFERQRISDWPDKDYRCFMVDIARQWHPFEELFSYVDLCFFFKTRYLHIHFMDAEGYALPSKVFPKLSLNGNTYTFAQMKELCQYAKDRGILLIPEVEMPGHVTVLNKVYPEVFSDKIDGEVDTMTIDTGADLNAEWVLCAGSKSAFEGITKLIDEVVEIFGDIPYIHLGGDEVNSAVWEQCSVCRAYMREHGLQNGEELYAEFLGRVTDYALSKGLRPVIWEGFAKEYAHHISRDVLVIAWETKYQTPQELLESGFRIVNGSWKPLYIVSQFSVPRKEGEWGIREILNWNLYEWQNWWEEAESGLNPIHIQPTDALLGGQVSSWGQTYEEEITFVVRFLASAMERIWSVRRYRNYETFTKHYKIQSRKAFRLII